MNKGQIYEELVKDYGKEPSEEVQEILEYPELYRKSFWLTHQDLFFRIALLFSALTLLFFILL